MVFRAPILLVISAAAAFAQPFINYRGVVNAASYAPQGLPAGSIARGSIFSVFGRNLGPTTYATATAFPLANALGGVSVDITQGSTTLAAIPIFVLNSQISAIMPSNVPVGKVAVRVRFNNQRSNPAIVNVVESSVGLFSINSAGFGPAVLQNFVTATDQPINTARVTAKPGQFAILWATGLGPVSHADNIAPTAADLPIDVEIFVGGKAATRRYAGRSSCCSGLDQIVFDVPADAPRGCFVPVQVRTNHGAVSNAATIAIDSDGRACADTFNPLGEALREGGRVAIVSPHRFDVRINLFDAPEQIVTDQIDVALQAAEGGDTWFHAAASLPPVGSCTSYGGATSSTLADLVRLLAPNSRILDGGNSLQLGSATLARRDTAPRLYRALLGQQGGTPPDTPLFFSYPGAFDFLIPGGADVQRGQTRFDASAAIRWTNQDQLSAITRSSGLTVNWTGGDPANDVVIAAILSSDDDTNSAGLGLCLAPADAGSLAVPSYILATLPASSPNARPIPAWVFVASARVRNPGRITAPGLDSGFIVPAFVGAKAVVVR
jgi:uncharacterized protein (TIGR03437 family)